MATPAAQIEAPRCITSKYAGTCTSCGGYYSQGASILWTPGVKGAVHAECPAVPAKPPVTRTIPAVEVRAELALACEARNRATEEYERVRGVLLEMFVARGGCIHCEGRGGYYDRFNEDNVACECGAKIRGGYDAATEARVAGASMAQEFEGIAGRLAAAIAKVQQLEELLSLDPLVQDVRGYACEVDLRGKNVRVAKGRKVPVGTVGTLIWVGEGTYGWRAGVKDAAGTVYWTALSNLEVDEVAVTPGEITRWE